MSLNLYRAVQAARLLLEEGHLLPRASTVAAADFGADADEVARLAWLAHTECRAARARPTDSEPAPAGLPGITLELHPMKFKGSRPPAAMLAAVRQTHVRAVAASLVEHPGPFAVRAPGLTAAEIRTAHQQAHTLTRKGA